MKISKHIKPNELTTRQLILKSAEETFLECGFQAAPLRRIASEAGYSPGAVYGYYPSKEELFYALTDPLAEDLMSVLERVQNDMEIIPEENRLFEMGSVYYKRIPEIVDILLSDRNAVKLIVRCSKGTKYEGFLDNIAKINAVSINNSAENTEEKKIEPIKEQTMDILMEGYIRTLFELIISDKDRDTIIECMEMIGKIYENGIITLMKKGD